MKVRHKFGKCINFSLISNCIIFNTLARCSGGNKENGNNNKENKGCSGSGKDGKNNGNGNTQGQSPEELAKKQKEEDEKKEKEKKAKEEADRLAKDKVALDAKKQELITKLKGLVKEINKVINVYEDNDLHIDTSELVTEKAILDSGADQFVKYQTSVEELNNEVNDKKNSINQRNIIKAKIKNEFNPTFKTLIEQVDEINNPNKYDIKINSDAIITQEQINNCKFAEIDDITNKLTNLGNEIKAKFDSIKVQLKTKLTELQDLIGKPGKNLLKLTCDIKDSDINGINLNGINDIKKLNEIFRKIDELLKIINLKPKEFVARLENFLKEHESLFKFLEKKTDTCFEELTKYKNNVVTLINGLKKDEKHIEKNGELAKKSITDYNNFKNKLEEKVKEYNKKYISRLTEIITKNNKLEINLNYSKKTINELTEKEIINEYYKHNVNLKYEINEEDIKKKISVNYDKSTEDLVKIENGVLKNLEDQVNNQEEQFIEDIKNTFNFLKSSYQSLSDDIKNANLVDTSVDNLKESINKLFNYVKTCVSDIIKDAKAVGTGGESISLELKDKLTKFGLYKDDEDKISTLDASLLEFSQYFDNNHSDTGINDKLIKLKDEINNNNIVEQRRKIYKRLKSVIAKYNELFSSDVFKYSPIKRNDENLYILDPFCDNLDAINAYCNFSNKDKNIGESLLSVCGNIPELKEKYFYIIDCPEFDTNTKFNDIDKYLKNFELIFNHNAKILKKMKEYFENNLNEIKNLNYKLDGNFKFHFFSDEINKGFKDILTIDVEECFGVYLDCGKFFISTEDECNKIDNLDKKIYSFAGDMYSNIKSSRNYILYFGSKSSDIDDEKDKKDLIYFNYVFLNIDVFKYFIYLLYLRFGKDRVVDDKNFKSKLEKNEAFHVNNYFERLKKSESKDKGLKDIDFYSYINVIAAGNPGIVFKKTSGEETTYYILFNEFYKYFKDSENEFFKCGLLDKKVLNWKGDDDSNDSNDE